ncbi:MAG: hypothetical protein KDA78_12505, partial [Planctomycetaceae bacterium]|nr:hypothetical protein [Planctomycetaceae bacterium]
MSIYSSAHAVRSLFRKSVLNSRKVSSVRRNKFTAQLNGTEALESRLLLSSVVGTIYNDIDGNGVRTAGEDGLSGWTVYLDIDQDGTLSTLADGSPEPSAVTNVDGDYTIRNVLPGTYRVTELIETGWRATQPASRDISVVSGADATVNFLNFAGGTITGFVWNDQVGNGDGIRDVDPVTGDYLDVGLEGWTVFLDLNKNSLPDADEPSTLTDAEGRYEFIDVPTGITYEVTELLPAGWEVSKTFDTKQSAEFNALETFVLDFANFSLTNGSIQGSVWNDANLDGIRNVDSTTGEFTEPGLADWTIFLDLNHNGVLDGTEPSTLTNEDGNYSFISLSEGDYEVTEILPAGWDVSPGYDVAQTVGVTGGERTTAGDFANFTVENGSLRGIIWNDLN